MSAFVVIDLETTHREPADAHIVEWATILMQPPWFGQGGTVEAVSLVKPPVPIPPETSAVHHIIDADVANAPTIERLLPQIVHHFMPIGQHIAVAHNADYEREVLAKHDPFFRSIPWLCTYKAAVRVWPDCPSFSNECLRYYLGLGTGRRTQQAAHSALHDARVTLQILGELLHVGTSIENMLAWTKQPAMLPTCPLGDWRGKKWSEVDAGFLQWIVRKIGDRPDVVFCAKAELDRREKEHEDVRKAKANTAAA
jgi:exodeoxyribonuclease X